MSKAKAAQSVMNYLRKLFDDLPDQVKKDLPEQPKGGGLRVFHGSDKEYQTMDISAARKQDQFLGEGFYFTIDPKIAKEYANMRAINQLEKLSPEQRARIPELIQKKLVTPKEVKEGAVHNFKGEIVKVDGILKNKNVEGKSLGNLGQNVKEFEIDVKKPYVVKTEKQRRELKDKTAELKAQGYDSVVFDSFKDRSKQIMVFPEYIDKIKKVGAFETLFNKGGTTMKNNPPVGSFPEEVADDIPAMISEGEFVIPADVVRYVGLDKIHCMMRDAKMGLKAMEHEGLIVDVDEEGRPEEPQEEPKGEVAIIDVVQIEKAEPMVKELKEGGVVSPILNPEEEVNVMNQGGMLTQTTAPDGSLVEFQEGGMVDQMNAMMGEEMPREAPDMAQEMPPAQTDPMPDVPTLNAPLAQVINDVPHVLAYLQEDEIKALHSAGRGLDEQGKQKLSPEGVPVFIGDPSEASAAADAADAGTDPGQDDEGDEEGADPGLGESPSEGPDGGPDGEPGDMDDDSIKKMQEELTKEDKQSLDPSGSDRIYKAGVGFIDKIINARLQSQVNRPNPLQGMPQYNVATVAQGGLMRSPVYFNEGGMADNIGGMEDDEDNRRFEGPDAGGSIPSDPVDTMMDNIPSPVASEEPVTSEEAPSEPNIASDEQVAERLPELFDSRTGERFDIFGMEGGNRAAQILGEDPDISDASLDYLRQNRDVFLNAKDRVDSDEDVSYEAVAQQHYNLFGKDEDRIGAEGLMRMQQEQSEESVGDAIGDIAGGIMSPPEESRSPEEPVGSYIYNKNMFADNAEMLDQETNELLRSSGMDSEEWGDSVREYRAGNTSSLDSELVDNLNKLDDKRRIIKEGITLDDIPEGATNRDIYKKVFFNQTDDFGSKYVEPVQGGGDYDSNRYDSVETILNADLSKFDPKTRRGAEALAYLQLFKLDDPASETDLKYINRAIKAIADRQAIPGYDDRGTYDTNPYENTSYRQPPTWEWSREARLQRIDDLMEGRTTDMTDAERNRHLKEDVFKVA